MSWNLIFARSSALEGSERSIAVSIAHVTLIESNKMKTLNSEVCEGTVKDLNIKSVTKKISTF